MTVPMNDPERWIATHLPQCRLIDAHGFERNGVPEPVQEWVRQNWIADHDANPRNSWTVYQKPISTSTPPVPMNNDPKNNKIAFPDGSFWEGETKYNGEVDCLIPHGNGVLMLSNVKGSKIDYVESVFVDGVHGPHGTIVYKCGDMYVGELSEDDDHKSFTPCGKGEWFENKHSLREKAFEMFGEDALWM